MRSRSLVLGGAVIGFLIWAYDYDFFLNVGGPRTPTSDAIRRVSGLDPGPAALGLSHDAYTLLYLFWPPLLLVGAGAACGGVIAWLFARWSRR